MERNFIICTILIAFVSCNCVYAEDGTSVQAVNLQPITTQQLQQTQTQTHPSAQTHPQVQVQQQVQTNTQGQSSPQPSPQIQTQPQPKPPAVTVQNIPFESCVKMFSLNKEQLFYLTLGALNANKFTVEEIQSYNGYIIFTAARQKYLATISGVDKDNSIIKITPCNNIYYFQPGIITNIYKFIELNKNTELK